MCDVLEYRNHYVDIYSKEKLSGDVKDLELDHVVELHCIRDSFVKVVLL